MPEEIGIPDRRLRQIVADLQEPVAQFSERFIEVERGV